MWLLLYLGHTHMHARSDHEAINSQPAPLNPHTGASLKRDTYVSREVFNWWESILYVRSRCGDAASEARSVFGTCPRATLPLSLRPVSRHLARCNVQPTQCLIGRRLEGILHLINNTTASVDHTFASTAALSSYLAMLAECASNITSLTCLHAKCAHGPSTPVAVHSVSTHTLYTPPRVQLAS